MAKGAVVLGVIFFALSFTVSDELALRVDESNGFPVALEPFLQLSGVAYVLLGFGFALVDRLDKANERARAVRRQAVRRSTTVVSDHAREATKNELAQLVRDELAKVDASPDTEQVVLGLADRLERVEGRLPDQGTIDKLESINDAIMATKIDALELEVRRLGDAALTKWGVALIVFSVLGVLAALIAALAAISALLIK